MNPSSKTQPHNILVIKLGALGDFVQSLGPMKAIRQHHKNDHITLLTTKPFADFARESKYFDDIELDTRPKFFDLAGWISLRKKLNQPNYTRVYDLQNNDRTGFYFKLLNPKPEWVGIAKGASHRNTSPQRTSGLAFDGHAQTLSLAGIKDVQIDTMAWINADLSPYNLQSPYILLVPGCAPTRPEKRWPATHYGTLAQKLKTAGYRPVIIGTDGEKELAETILSIEPACLDLMGKTKLMDIPTLAENAHYAIGNDTGPMHLIGPTECKSLVLFSGNSQPHRHKPLGKNVETIQIDNLNDLEVDQVFNTLNLN